VRPPSKRAPTVPTSACAKPLVGVSTWRSVRSRTRKSASPRASPSAPSHGARADGRQRAGWTWRTRAGRARMPQPSRGPPTLTPTSSICQQGARRLRLPACTMRPCRVSLSTTLWSSWPRRSTRYARRPQRPSSAGAPTLGTGRTCTSVVKATSSRIGDRTSPVASPRRSAAAMTWACTTTGSSPAPSIGSIPLASAMRR